jgi:hypothetical protein
MLDFDQTRTWKPIQEKLDRTTNPRHRKMLQELLNHASGETEADLEKVLATLSPNPVYKGVRRGPPESQPKGAQEVRAFYVNEIFGRGRYYLEGNKDRIVVDDDTIITEGMMRLIRWGRDLVEDGVPVDDENACYLMTTRILIVWPFDADGKIIGEESWSQPATASLQKLADQDVPPQFKAYVAKREAEAA